MIKYLSKEYGTAIFPIKTSSILMMKKNVKNAIVHIKRGEYTVDP